MLTVFALSFGSLLVSAIILSFADRGSIGEAFGRTIGSWRAWLGTVTLVALILIIGS